LTDEEQGVDDPTDTEFGRQSRVDNVSFVLDYKIRDRAPMEEIETIH